MIIERPDPEPSHAMKYENSIRKALWMYDPTQATLYPRPGYLADVDDLGSTVREVWKNYDWRKLTYGRRRQ